MLRASGPFYEVARRGREKGAERGDERVQRTMVREHPMQMRVFDKSMYPVRSESTPNVGVIPESKSRFSGVRPESKPESFSEV